MLGWILALLVLAVIGFVAWKWRAILQPPARAPEYWSESLRPESGPVVLCLGDSITHGHLGSDWTEMLARRGLCVVNGGINGDLAWNLVQRLDQALACRPDVITILIGANDSMGSYDQGSARRYVKEKGIPRLPDLAWYEENLRALLSQLREKSQARIALLTLAPIGEDPGEPIAKVVAECNAIIARVAAEQGVPVLPLHDRLAALLPDVVGERSLYVPGFRSRSLMISAGVLRYLLGMSWDRIAARRGFTLTIDLVHLSDRAGAVVSDLVEEFALEARA